MPVERSAGIILFRNTPAGREYLVIRSSNSSMPERPEFWDFPKGVLDKGETGIEAARREVREEVGIEDFEIMPEFKETVHYFTRREGKPVPKYIAMFLAEAKNHKVTLSWEHSRYEWLPYEGARRRITREEMKKALDAAHKFLSQKSV